MNEADGHFGVVEKESGYQCARRRACESSSGGVSRKKRASLSCHGWFPAVSALSLKYIILCIRGFRESALGLRSAGFLTVAEKVLLFRSDLLLGFVLMPVVLFCLTYFLPIYVRLAVSATVSLLAQNPIVNGSRSLRCNKWICHGKDLWTVTKWALTKHDGSIIWMLPIEAAGLVVWVVAAVLAIAIAFASVRRQGRWANYVCLSIFGVGAAVSALASVPRSPRFSMESAPACDDSARSLGRYGYRRRQHAGTQHPGTEPVVPEGLALSKGLSFHILWQCEGL